MKLSITSDGIKVIGRKALLGWPWPWRWPHYWQWYIGPGPFATSSGLIMHAMNFGIATPFFQMVTSELPVRGWNAYVTLPWHLVRYAFAWCWTETWRLYLKCKYRRYLTLDKLHGGWMTSPGHGRHTDPRPVLCPLCLWGGARRWLYHTYGPCGVDDVEPVDECPRCGTEL
jgi:hypothetical protein